MRGLGKGGAISLVLIVQATAEEVHVVYGQVKSRITPWETWSRRQAGGHEASPQSGLGVGWELFSSSKRNRGLSVRAPRRRGAKAPSSLYSLVLWVLSEIKVRMSPNQLSYLVDLELNWFGNMRP